MDLWKKHWQKIIPMLLGIGILVLLFMRIEIATQRFFDVDEYTHMHWAAQIFIGEKPYIDFYTFFPPGFHWIIQPLFWFFSDSASIFVAGRIVGVVTFVALLAVVVYLFARYRSTKYALLPAFILAFLPMPYDKFFEIRPDTMSTLFGFVGVILLSLGWREEKRKRQQLYFTAAGVIFAVCVLVLPKMLPFVMVAGMVVTGKVGLELWQKEHVKKMLWKYPLKYIHELEPLIFLVLGGAIIGLLFVIWLLSLGDFGTVWYSLMKAGVEGNQIGKFFIMEPHLFFFPNSSFYGGEGMTLSYLSNHTIWIIALFWGVFRLFTPYVTAKNGKTTVADEFMMTGIFFVSVYGYVYFFPLKHTQYLIPIGVFIAFYAADFLVSVMNWVENTLTLTLSHPPSSESVGLRRTSTERGKSIVQIGLVCLLIYIGIAVNKELNTRKINWNNSAQLQEFTLLTDTIPKTAVVVDLEGKMLTWKNGYYVCCLAFGQFGSFLSRPLPNFAASLQKNNVEYIYQGDSGRLTTLLAEDYAYVTSAYAPVEGWYNKLWKRK